MWPSHKSKARLIKRRLLNPIFRFGIQCSSAFAWLLGSLYTLIHVFSCFHVRKCREALFTPFTEKNKKKVVVFCSTGPKSYNGWAWLGMSRGWPVLSFLREHSEKFISSYGRRRVDFMKILSQIYRSNNSVSRDDCDIERQFLESND